MLGKALGGLAWCQHPAQLSDDGQREGLSRGPLCVLSLSADKAGGTGECWENSQNLSSSSCFWEVLLLIFLLLVDRWKKPSTVEVTGGIQSSPTLSKSASWPDYKQVRPTHSLNECHKTRLIPASQCSCVHMPAHTHTHTYSLTNTCTLTHKPWQ